MQKEGAKVAGRVTVSKQNRDTQEKGKNPKIGAE